MREFKRENPTEKTNRKMHINEILCFIRLFYVTSCLHSKRKH